VLLLHCSSSILGRPRLTGQAADSVGYLACGRATWLGASWSSDGSGPSISDTASGKSLSSRGGAGCCNAGNIVLAMMGDCIGCCDGKSVLVEWGTGRGNPAVPWSQPGLPASRVARAFCSSRISLRSTPFSSCSSFLSIVTCLWKNEHGIVSNFSIM
jgi:hypothetical protein